MKLNESIPISLKASENLGQMYSNIKDESNRHCLKSCERPVSQMSNSEENMTQVYSDTTECGGSIEMQDSEEKSYNGMSRDPLPAQNDFVSKTKGQQKRQRQTSSSEENSSHQHKSSSPGSYRTNKKWRKLQHGPLGENNFTFNVTITGHTAQLGKMNSPSKIEKRNDTDFKPTMPELCNKYEKEISDVVSCTANLKVQGTSSPSQVILKGLEIRNSPVKIETINNIYQLFSVTSGGTQETDNSILEYVNNDIKVKIENSLSQENLSEKETLKVSGASQIDSSYIQIQSLPSSTCEIQQIKPKARSNDATGRMHIGSESKNPVTSECSSELLLQRLNIPCNQQSNRSVFCPGTDFWPQRPLVKVLPVPHQLHASRPFNNSVVPGFPFNLMANRFHHPSSCTTLFNYTRESCPSFPWSFVNPIWPVNRPHFEQNSTLNPRDYVSHFNSHLPLSRQESQTGGNNQKIANWTSLDLKLLNSSSCPGGDITC